MSDEPIEQDVEALGQMIVRAWEDEVHHREAARQILTSAWYAERLTEARREGAAEGAAARAPRPMPVCTDPECTISRKPGFPMHGPHDFRAALRGDA